MKKATTFSVVRIVDGNNEVERMTREQLTAYAQSDEYTSKDLVFAGDEIQLSVSTQTTVFIGALKTRKPRAKKEAAAPVTGRKRGPKPKGDVVDPAFFEKPANGANTQQGK